VDKKQINGSKEKHVKKTDSSSPLTIPLFFCLSTSLD
jgi:hypothetical protein